MAAVVSWEPPVRVGGPIRLLPIIEELFIVTKERGVVRFGDVMNYAQRDLILECERQLNTLGMIRVIVLKARQIGISTAIEAILFVLSTFLDRFQSLIVSHEAKSAEHILSITRNYWETFVFQRFYVDQYNGRTQLSWRNNGSGMQVATAKNLGSGRSRTIQALHASEAAFYDDPDTLMTGLRQAIPQVGMSAIFLESTANGIGNYFHRTWVDSVANRNEFSHLFFPWHQHPEYRASMLPSESVARHQLGKLDDEERALRAMGVSDDRLIWRRYAIVNLCQGSIDKFHQEYPSTPHEAFLSTGRNVCPLPQLLQHYQPWRGTRGKLQIHGQRVEFVEHERGWLTIYRYPAKDREWGRHMIVGADPTHTVAGDFACAQVLNRRTLEQCAVYRRHCDPIQFAKDLYLLGLFYHQALLVPEKEGPGYATVGHLVGVNYPNVWESQRMVSTPGKPIETFGWSTNVATKHEAIQTIVHYLSDPLVTIGQVTYGLLIHDEDTYSELRDYVTTEDGRGYENGDGSKFDDGVMALGIALSVHDHEPKPPHYNVAQDDPHSPSKPPIKPVKRAVETVESLRYTPDDAHQSETPADDDAPTEPATEEAPWDRWDELDAEMRDREGY